MKTIIYAISALTISFSAFAIQPSSEQTFCSDREQKGFVQELINDHVNTVGFRNKGGLINGGVCWWHSRLTRNAAYLAYFSPEKPKPTSSEEVKAVLRQLRKGNAPVEVPGFKNLYSFTRAYSKTVQKYLDHWQRESGMISQSWIKGISGKAVRSPDKLKKELDKTYSDIQEGKIVYQKLQIKGIVAHAWLVNGMEKTPNGYILNVLDSNYSGTETYRYVEGRTHFYHPSYGRFSPYSEKKKKEKKMQKAIKKYCNN